MHGIPNNFAVQNIFRFESNFKSFFFWHTPIFDAIHPDARVNVLFLDCFQIIIASATYFLNNNLFMLHACELA